MPRGRKQLSEKQERILIQCQLMGLTTADMVQISNRLRALDTERDFKARVDEFCQGFTWNEKSKREFTVTDSDGKIYDVKVKTDYNRRNWTVSGQDYATVHITKPGTRFKPKTVNGHHLTSHWEDTEIAGVCPNGNKYLFRIMRDIKKGKLDK